MSLNVCVIQGRLTRDPDLRRTGNGIAVASFSVAVDRDYPNSETGERETDFINCVAWRQKGEFVSKYFTKGSMIVVSGRLQMRKWVDNNGNNRVTAEVVAEDVYFGESKKSDSGAPSTSNYTAPNTYSSSYPMFDDSNETLPF